MKMWETNSFQHQSHAVTSWSSPPSLHRQLFSRFSFPQYCRELLRHVVAGITFLFWRSNRSWHGLLLLLSAAFTTTIPSSSGGTTRTVAAFRSLATQYHHHHHPLLTTNSYSTTNTNQPSSSLFNRPTLSFSGSSTNLRFTNSPPPEGSFIDINPDDGENDDEDSDNKEDNVSNNIMDAMEGDVVLIILEPNENESLLEEEEEEEEDDDDDDEEEDPYIKVAASEFQNKNDTKNDNNKSRDVGALTVMGKDELGTTTMDWGRALSTLRERAEDVETGKSRDPSHVLFRMMSSQTPNQIIGQFISNANPMVVQAMSGAIGSLLGGLSNPNMGVETIVKASGEKIGSLCFQLQMTGYMFRNAEYVLALKDVMDLKGRGLTLNDYKDAFDRVDIDGNGYIDMSEIQQLFQEVYGEGKVPPYEVTGFLKFFDQNKDGKISWEEFEKGFGAAIATAKSGQGDLAARLLDAQGYKASHDDDDDDDDEDVIDVSSTVSGTIEIELKDGKVVEVDAKEYIQTLREEAQKLKDALRREKMGPEQKEDSNTGLIPNNNNVNGSGMDIATYISSRQGDVKSLTEGISPEVVDTMKKLVDFVLEGGDSKKSKNTLTGQDKTEIDMEIPGSALQQLALWQLVLGYRLREEEVKGDYVKLLNG